MEDFKCVTDAMIPLIENLRAIQRELDDSLADATNVLNEIKNDGAWKGEAALVGWAFLDLVVKYHTQLAGGEENGPVTQACAGLAEYMSNDGSFYSEWSQYQTIKGM